MKHSLRFAKTFSTKIIPKGWVKFNGNPATKVITKDCTDITDFIENIKQELPRQLSSVDSNEITLHMSETSDPLSPGVSIAKALKNVIFKLTLELCRNTSVCKSSSSGSTFSWFIKNYFYSGYWWRMSSYWQFYRSCCWKRWSLETNLWRQRFCSLSLDQSQETHYNVQTADWWWKV